LTGTQKTYLAVDLGASSGRVLAGKFDGKKIQLEEVHRFENGGVKVGPHLYWDLLRLWSDIKDGLRKSHQMFGDTVCSVGVDTWGVDFGLLGANDELLGNPFHYRDSQNHGMLDLAFGRVDRRDIFQATGLQFMEFNSLYQLLALQQRKAAVLDGAQSFLMMPDLFHWLLSGEKSNEMTNATTSQCFNPQTNQWAKELLDRFGLPTDIFGPLSPPGTTLGKLQASVVQEVGLPHAQVILPGTHDTASAVMAVPAQACEDPMPDWCYISSGTWSLMGVETAKPQVTDRVFDLNFTNEGGVGGTTRVLKNIAGLWLIQECRRVWSEAGQNYDWGQLVQMAEAAPALQSFIAPDHGCFLAPDSMPDAIRNYCQQTGQAVPESEGAVIRCALESLALRYRQVLEWLEEITGRRIERIHIVGGGTQNELLCQMAADACRRSVITGPVEATAIGNLMLQAVALGDCASVAEARDVIRASFEVKTFTPVDADPWDDAYTKFKTLTDS
jgi:rhamnulokinase